MSLLEKDANRKTSRLLVVLNKLTGSPHIRCIIDVDSRLRLMEAITDVTALKRSVRVTWRHYYLIWTLSAVRKNAIGVKKSFGI